MAPNEEAIAQVEQLMEAGHIPPWMINTLAEGVQNCSGGAKDGTPCPDCERVLRLPGILERIMHWETITRGVDT